jgi:ribosome biogenesis GTPase YqeH
MEEIRCIGCGSIIQSDDSSKPGYVPKSKLDSEDIICRRCFRLKNYNEVIPVSITKDDYINIISEIGNKDSLIVMLIDIFDIEGSLIPQIAKLTNHNDLVVIANKVDLLPKSVKENKLLHHLRKIVSDNNLKPIDIFLMSAIKNKNLDHIIDSIEALSSGRDIYIVGATNVGKSTFINALIKNYAGVKEDVITVSSNAGTTLDLIKIPFEDQDIIDTPGLINENQLTHYLGSKTLKMVTPKKEIKPKVYQLESKQTLFIGGLARVDFISGEKGSFVCYFSEFLKVHRTKLEKADHLYETSLFNVLTPPFKEEGKLELSSRIFNVSNDKKYDIVFPGLGFITVKGAMKLKVYASLYTTPYIREALI